MAKTTITVPDIGGAEGAEVVEVLVAVGDSIELEQSLIVLESDKASMEIPATAAGQVLELKVAVGDQLAEGDAIVVVDAEAEDAAATGASNEPEPQTEPAAAEAGAEDPESAPEAESGSDGAGGVITVAIPDIGTDGEVDLVEWVVEPGQTVEEGDSLVVLESDKASMEVPAPCAGTVVKQLVTAGSSVREGTPVMELETTGGAPVAQPSGATATSETPASMETKAEPTPAQASASAPTPESAGTDTESAATSGADVYAGPAVRKLAREFGIDLTQVGGSGPRGRILKEDLHRHVSTALSSSGGASAATAVQGAGIPAIPEVDFSKFGDIDPTQRSRVDKVTAANMSRAWLNLPHVTHFDDADITDLEAFRKELKAEAEQRGVKITPLPFILKACAVALNANPKLKASLADGGETLVYKDYCHIGMAVDTPAGLVVPVVRDVDQKSIWEIAAEVAELAGLARDKKLRPDQMQGGVFSISSLGGIGGRGFTPIVNAPEVAILGVSRAGIQPVWNGSEFVPRNLLPLSLSYDHRVVNGGDAGRFFTQLVGLLSDIRRVLM